MRKQLLSIYYTQVLSSTQWIPKVTKTWAFTLKSLWYRNRKSIHGKKYPETSGEYQSKEWRCCRSEKASWKKGHLRLVLYYWCIYLNLWGGLEKLMGSRSLEDLLYHMKKYGVSPVLERKTLSSRHGSFLSSF